MAQTRKVTTIPATLTRFTEMPLDKDTKRRVAAYARVSTDSDEQFSSYEAQVEHYTSYIKEKSDWEYVGIYTDEGISGTSTRKREGFRTMVADALAGKMDLIITKSVSRFARNTVDSLVTIRQLKEHGVEVFFEKENIWTFDSKGEMLLTIMSSLAQEESRSISENVTWGVRKRFSDGKVTVPYKRFLGYDRGEDGGLIVNEKQAEIVRYIFSSFLLGKSPYAIAEELTEKGIPTPGGKAKWHQGTVRSILSNEKYAGDAILQKTYTPDFLSKKRKVNHGEVPKYLVENNHEAIVSKEQFEMVQEILKPGEGKSPVLCTSPFSGKVRCGQCGSLYGRKVWHSTDKYRRSIWQCNCKFENKKKCTTPHLTDGELEKAYMTAFNKLITNRDELSRYMETSILEALDTTTLKNEKEKTRREIEVVSALVVKSLSSPVIREEGTGSSDFDVYSAKLERLKKRYQELTEEIGDKSLRFSKIRLFLDELEKEEEIIKEFCPEQFAILVDRMTVYSRTDIRVTFTDGTTI